MNNVKVVIYARNTKRCRINEQVDELVDYCFQKGWIVVGIVTDTSACDKVNRRKIRKLLKIAQSNEAKMVVVRSASRVSRKPQAVDEVLEMLHSHDLLLYITEVETTIDSSINLIRNRVRY